MNTAARVRPAGRHADLWRQWLAVALALLALAAWLVASGTLRRLDHLAQDGALRLFALPASPQIVIVAIDDASLDAIGRWPWRRALHAQAIAQIAAQSPRAMALDVLFGEPDADYPGDDLLLARAIERAGNVVLPVARRAAQAAGSAVDAPLPLLRSAAAQLGHVQVELDEGGSARHLFRLEGPRGGPWPHASVALLCAAGQPQPGCRGSAAPAAGPWMREGRQGVVFGAGWPAFVHYSYVDLLKGRLAPDALRDKYVLVGATAVGLGDMFAAPAVAPASRMAGVELLAHTLNAELAGRRVRTPGLAASLLFNLAPVMAALVGLVLLGPLGGLLACIALALASLLAAALAAPLLGWELPVAPALVTIALAYPLWSWRRLSAAAQFLQLQMQQLQRQVPLAPQAHAGAAALMGDALERRIAAVREASARLQQLHHFISESLQHLPLPTLVCNSGGHVLLANAAAAAHLRRGGDRMLGQPATQLLADLVDPADGQPVVRPHTLAEAAGPARAEGRDSAGRDVLVLCQPHALDGARLWLITLVDLTAIRHAQQQRNQALHFISHDIRAPAASILTLLEMQREFPGQQQPGALLARIERHAQACLSMAQDFVQLASAQADQYRHEPVDLADVLHEALDHAWVAAQEHQVALHAQDLPAAAAVQGDRSLILRAIGNVLGNAIKFSPPGGNVHCTLQPQAGHWCIAIRDEGPGIPVQLHADIFEPFKRLPQAGGAHAQRVAGAGLGLAFVRTVMQRHGGSVQLDSAPGQGSSFRLLLPQAGGVPAGQGREPGSSPGACA